MKTVKRIISLEDFKSRFDGKTPYINNNVITTPDVTENNWGFIPLDCAFNNLSSCPFGKVKDKLLLTDGIDISSVDEKIVKIKNVFRYKDIIKWLKWLETYSKTAKYYMLCNRKNTKKWVEIEGDFFSENYNIDNYSDEIKSYTNVALTSTIVSGDTTQGNNENIVDGEIILDENATSITINATIGTIIEVNDEAETLNSFFRIPQDRTRYELILYKFIKDYLNGNITCDYSIPFFDLPLYINQKYDNIGTLKPYVTQWNPKKKYYKGDVVLYNKNTYILENGDNYELTKVSGGLYSVLLKMFSEMHDLTQQNNEYYYFIEYSHINEESDLIYSKVYHNNKRIIYFEENNSYITFYLPTLMHKALYDITKGEYIFNETFWVKNSVIEEADILNEDKLNEKVNSITETRLPSVRRVKTSVDDDGNVLSFIISEDGSTDTELPYMMGISQICLETNDLLRAHVMSEIIFENDLGTETTSYKYVSPNEVIVQKILKIELNNEILDNIELYAGKKDNNDEFLVLARNIEEDTYSYDWVENSVYDTPQEGIEYITTLPDVSEEYYNKKVYVNKDKKYYEYECKIYEQYIAYKGITNNMFFIRPSHLMKNNKINQSNEGIVTFRYIIGALLNDTYEIDSNTGIKYEDKFQYEIIAYGINYVSDFEIEKLNEHKYGLYDYSPKLDDVILDKQPTQDFTYKNVGEIYRKEGDTIVNGEYFRVLSEYNAIEVKYDIKTDIYGSYIVENYRENPILSNISFSVGQTLEDEFENCNVLNDDYLMGVDEVVEDINIFAERGTSSAFERLHILSEVKTLNDLENYKNNYFKI